MQYNSMPQTLNNLNKLNVNITNNVISGGQSEELIKTWRKSTSPVSSECIIIYNTLLIILML